MSPRSRPAEDRRRFTPRVVPVGDSALMLELAEDVDLAANATARRVAAEVRDAGLDGITDVVAAIVTVTVHFAAKGAAEAAARREAVSHLLLAALARAEEADAEPERAPVMIPVCYERAFAPDLEEVAAATGLAPDEVVRLHVGSPNRVLMIGFVPGHAYVGGLHAKLATVPRRASPRARLDAGSVAIANGQTSLYPFATPGGWNIIGRTPVRLFDPLRSPASLLQAGDPVRFEPITAREFEKLAAETASR